MKIHLGINITPLNNYINLDPIPGDGKEVSDIKNLDRFCEMSECTELFAPDILNYIHGSELTDILTNYVSKLRHGGKIIIGGTDLIEMAKKIITGTLSMPSANMELFGAKKNVWDIKLGAFSVTEIANLLAELGLKIIRKTLTDYHFIIEAHRV